MGVLGLTAIKDAYDDIVSRVELFIDGTLDVGFYVAATSHLRFSSQQSKVAGGTQG